MDNCKADQQDSNSSLKEASNIPNINYIFYWQSNPNPFNLSESPTWDLYDSSNQNHLNLKYEEYLKDANNFCFPLLQPSDNHKVNFKEMKQIHKIDTFKIRPIKIENVIKNSQIKIQNKEEEFLFFWKANEDPWNLKEEPLWAPYDEEDQFILKESYDKYLAQKIINKVDLKKPADHYIDFSQMLQINKNDQSRQRPVQRCHPKLVTNIIRKNRFSASLKNSTFITEIVEQQSLNQDDFVSFLKSGNTEKKKNIYKIYFKVFPELFQELPFELEIEEQLCFFEDGSSIEISLTDIKSTLIQEISNQAKDESDLKEKKNASISYIKQIDQITDYKSFFEKIVFIYTMESYLYKKLNYFLRNMIKSSLKKFKYYYTCLLFSFKYFSKITKFNTNQDLIVYRASKFTQEEFEVYEAKKDTNIIRIFKEFLSTSREIEKALNFFKKTDEKVKEFFWEITIPKEIIRNEPNNFADICKFSNFDEKEILIRSGAILQIDQILPYTEQIGNQIVSYKNKFKKKCTLKSFSIASFLKLISLDSSIQILDLSNNDLNSNEMNMLYLKEALDKNNSIKELKIDSNDLGANEKNLFYLKEALEKNDSIKKLDLELNNLGSNEKNMFYLKEALEKNKSIEALFLGYNNLGSNENNIQYMKEVLEKNNTILILWLNNNDLGLKKKNMQNLKDALEKNNTIREVDISGNKLDSNESDLQFLIEALEKNNSIEILNILDNNLELKENKLFEIINSKKQNINMK